MSGLPKTWICPRCGEPVRQEDHELRLQLVNAHKSAPIEHTDIQAMFHARCAAEVWNAATDAWYGKQAATNDGEASEAAIGTGS